MSPFGHRGRELALKSKIAPETFFKSPHLNTWVINMGNRIKSSVSGFSLLELMVTLVVGSIAMIGFLRLGEVMNAQSKTVDQAATVQNIQSLARLNMEDRENCESNFRDANQNPLIVRVKGPLGDRRIEVELRKLKGKDGFTLVDLDRSNKYGNITLNRISFNSDIGLNGNAVENFINSPDTSADITGNVMIEAKRWDTNDRVKTFGTSITQKTFPLLMKIEKTGNALDMKLVSCSSLMGSSDPASSALSFKYKMTPSASNISVTYINTGTPMIVFAATGAPDANGEYTVGEGCNNQSRNPADVPCVAPASLWNADFKTSPDGKYSGKLRVAFGDNEINYYSFCLDPLKTGEIAFKPLNNGASKTVSNKVFITPLDQTRTKLSGLIVPVSSQATVSIEDAGYGMGGCQ